MERNKKRYRGQILQRLEPYTYLLPVSVIFGIFIYYPLVRTIRMSVSVVNSMGRVVSFCGLKNFVNLFSAGAFWNSLFLTIRFALMIVPAQIITGVFLGLLATDSFSNGSFICLRIDYLVIALQSYHRAGQLGSGKKHRLAR